MTSLPDNTTDRLLAVADIIEFTPERWDQDTWFRNRELLDPLPTAVIGRGAVKCGTTACVAGWAVALSSEVKNFWPWEYAGADALGLAYDMANDLFRSSLPLNATELADVLRRLAKLPEDERTYDGAKEVLTSGQYAVVFPE